MFEKLPEVEKAEWVEQAKEEHETALARWKGDNEGTVSEAPEDRQRCIQGLVRFAQPILDLIGGATGWNCTLIAGGPEPAQGGRLNMLSIHSGSTQGDVRMNFGRAERARYRKFIVPIYGQYLQKCYSFEECRARALAPEDEFEGLESTDLDLDGAIFDSCGFAKPAAPTTAPSAVAQPHTQDSENIDAPDSAAPTTASSAVAQPHTQDSENIDALNSAAPTTASSVVAQPHTQDSENIDAPNSPALSTRSRHITPPLSTVGSPPRSPPGSPRSRPASPTPQLAELAASPRGILSATPTPSVSSQPCPPSLVADDAAPQPPARPQTKKRGSKAPPPAEPNSKRSRVALSKGRIDPTILRPSRKKPARSSSSSSPSIVVAADATASTSVISASTGAPPWFSKALTMLQSPEIPLGERWAELVQLWATFEKQERYEEREKLSPVNRPQCVGEWINRARSPTWRPDIANVSAFEKQFRAWWLSLQPEWRMNAKGVIAVEGVDGDCDVLRKPGLNGLISVLAALFYWGRVAQRGTKQHGSWLANVEECIVVLRRLIE